MSILAAEEPLVTPGWIGFAVTAVLILVTIALIWDMVRRIRRVRYRAEAREQIAAELEAAVEGGEIPESPTEARDDD